MIIILKVTKEYERPHFTFECCKINNNLSVFKGLVVILYFIFNIVLMVRTCVLLACIEKHKKLD